MTCHVESLSNYMHNTTQEMPYDNKITKRDVDVEHIKRQSSTDVDREYIIEMPDKNSFLSLIGSFGVSITNLYGSFEHRLYLRMLILDLSSFQLRKSLQEKPQIPPMSHVRKARKRYTDSLKKIIFYLK